MSDHERELLGAIRAAPEEDEPRLVYADWVAEQGDAARGELIRVQCAKARLAPWDPGLVDLEVRERLLLAEHGDRWRAALPSFEGVLWGHFGRGFPDTIAFASGEALARHGEACMAACPATQAIVGWPRLEERAELAAVEGLVSLTVFGTLMDPADAEWLAGSPLLSTVRRLSVVGSRMDAGAFGALLGSAFAGQWESLSVRQHQFGDDGVALLVDAELPALRALDLSLATAEELASGGPAREAIGPEGAAALAGWEGLSGLTWLSLDGHLLRKAGLGALLSSSRVAGLERLSLRGLEYRGVYDGYEGEQVFERDLLSAFGETAEGLALRYLHLGHVELSPRMAKVLGGSPALAELQMLGLDRIEANRKGFRALFGSRMMASVGRLWAHEAPASLAHAVMLEAPPSLHTLELSPTCYRAPEIVEVITKRGPALPSLRVLDLSDASFEDWARLERLAKRMPNLECLRARGSWGVDEEKAAELAASAFAAGLRQLTLGVPSLDRAPAPQFHADQESVYRDAYMGESPFSHGLLKLLDPYTW